MADIQTRVAWDGNHVGEDGSVADAALPGMLIRGEVTAHEQSTGEHRNRSSNQSVCDQIGINHVGAESCGTLTDMMRRR